MKTTYERTTCIKLLIKEVLNVRVSLIFSLLLKSLSLISFSNKSFMSAFIHHKLRYRNNFVSQKYTKCQLSYIKNASVKLNLLKQQTHKKIDVFLR